METRLTGENSRRAFVDSCGRTIFVADAHRGDGQRFIVRADEKLTAFLELKAATPSRWDVNQKATCRRPFSWTASPAHICSTEHENTLSLPVGADIAQTNSQTSADGIEFMDSALKALIGAVRAIRDQADSVLRKIEQPSGERSLAWKCNGCGHIKHFTRPVPSDVASSCPKCKSTAFQAC